MFFLNFFHFKTLSLSLLFFLFCFLSFSLLLMSSIRLFLSQNFLSALKSLRSLTCWCMKFSSESVRACRRFLSWWGSTLMS